LKTALTLEMLRFLSNVIIYFMILQLQQLHGTV